MINREPLTISDGPILRVDPLQLSSEPSPIPTSSSLRSDFLRHLAASQMAYAAGP